MAASFATNLAPNDSIAIDLIPMMMKKFSAMRKRRGVVARQALQNGFTLLELMAVLAIAAILASIAIPSMQSLIDSSRISAQRDALAGAIKLARSEAVTRGLPVQLCASADGADCGGTLSDGWIVFENNNGAQTLIEVYQKSSDSLTLGGTFTGVTYQPSGMASAGGGTTFTVCPDASSTLSGRGFSLTVVGSITYDNDISCI